MSCSVYCRQAPPGSLTPAAVVLPEPEREDLPQRVRQVLLRHSQEATQHPGQIRQEHQEPRGQVRAGGCEQERPDCVQEPHGDIETITAGLSGPAQ